MQIPNWFIQWYNEWWVRHDYHTGTPEERAKRITWTAYCNGKKAGKLGKQ